MIAHVHAQTYNFFLHFSKKTVHFRVLEGVKTCGQSALTCLI